MYMSLAQQRPPGYPPRPVKPSKRSSKSRKLTAALKATAKKRGMTAAQSKASRKSGLALLKLLEDPLPTVRQAAGFALASVRDPALVQGFIGALDGRSSSAFARAALALGEAGYENAAPYFRAAFSRDDRRLSAALARALGQLGDRAAVPLLVEALEGDFVPVEAAEALGRTNDVQALPALVRALSHRQDAVRAAAAYAIACLEPRPDEEEQRIGTALTALRDDRSQRVRLCAAVARYERGESAALSDIKAALS
jgi:HEAT repeat protein